MSFEFFIRLVGMVAMALGGLQLGIRLSAMTPNSQPEIWGLSLALVGALIGIILTPYITTRPAKALRDYLSELPAQQLVAGVLGLIIGLAIAALLALPLSLLPSPYSAILPVIMAIVFGYFGTAIFAMRRRDIFELFQGRFPTLSFKRSAGNGLTPNRQILLDTSVIIDGRIADISAIGFVMGPIIIPRFVLNELQHIADSSDPLRRTRGRHGIDVLDRLQKTALVPVEISDIDIETVDAVDEKLILLAQEMQCAIVTNDYNLNRIAELQGVTVLNINELSNAVKSAYLPGEELTIQIIQEGREIGQGVGYLDDGTMVVIENGHHLIGRLVSTTVTRVLQTSAGKMIFARPNED
nr:TRAM domain-containing protein [Anaerolineae bacterium]